MATIQILIGNQCRHYRFRISFIARFVYTYEEFVFMTEAPQCNRMTVTEQKTQLARGFLLKSTVISTVLNVFSSRFLRLHQTASSLTSCLYADYYSHHPEWGRSVWCHMQNFRSLTEGSLDVQSLMYREKSSGERTQPWGAPVLIIRVLDENLPSLTSCCLSVRKLLIHWQTEVKTESCVSLFWRVSGMMVFKAELKSTNRILT